jgi:hypothetical protein
MSALLIDIDSGSIATLRSRWRELTNESSTTAVSDATIDTYIQAGMEALNRRIGYHFTTDSSSVTFVDGTQEYSLPSDCVTIVWVELGGVLLAKRDMDDWQRRGEDWRNEETGTPTEWAFYSNKLIMRPAPSGACVAATPNPTIRYVSRPGSFTANGMLQLDVNSRDLPVYFGAAEYLATPSSAMDLGYAKVLYERFEAEAQLAAASYKERMVAR